ncbi:hypothetical protein LMG23994_07074 [Cupriavidus pinatubonensis]|uniref:Transposase n=1 Tax=Cupriavidus pinatubonensis TaxID=248026 RepID=A0ABN7ZNU0_9BURK|nr:hypothetical protein LMG23994_07074 [Cupriavidus pinatubonensis]
MICLVHKIPDRSGRRPIEDRFSIFAWLSCLCLIRSLRLPNICTPRVFHDLARHPEHPAAFTRQRKLTLPTLISFMLGNLRMGMQAELDQFFATLSRQNTLRLLP